MSVETEEEGKKLRKGRTRSQWKDRQEKVRESIRVRGMKQGVEYRAKNAVKYIVFLCFKCPVSTAVNQQAVIPLGTLDYIRVPGKLCSSWFMIPFESPEWINDIICDVTHTGNHIISGMP